MSPPFRCQPVATGEHPVSGIEAGIPLLRGQGNRLAFIVLPARADYFYGDVPCARALTAEEITREYEKQTGVVIAQTLGESNPLHTPGVIVYQHGPFCWGEDAEQAVHNVVVLEEVAEIAWLAYTLNPRLPPLDAALKHKHFSRKHGPDAYYGQ